MTERCSNVAGESSVTISIYKRVVIIRVL